MQSTDPDAVWSYKEVNGKPLQSILVSGGLNDITRKSMYQ